MRTLQHSSTWRRHTGILPGALEGPMKRGALRLRVPMVHPKHCSNALSPSNLATYMRTSCRQGPHLSILPNTSARWVLWLKSFVVSPKTPCIFLPMCFFILSPLAGMLFLYPWISISCPPVDPWFVDTSLRNFSWPPPLSQAVMVVYLVCGACHVCSWESGLTGTSSTVLPDCKPLEERVQVSLFLSFRPRDMYLLDSQ